MRVQAQFLRPGDHLTTGETVVSNVHAGLSIPRGKCEITLDKAGIKRWRVHWNKRTEIRITREDQNDLRRALCQAHR